jgi:hypothetical protein
MRRRRTSEFDDEEENGAVPFAAPAFSAAERVDDGLAGATMFGNGSANFSSSSSSSSRKYVTA